MSRELVIQMLKQAEHDPSLRNELDGVLRAEKGDKVTAFLAAAGARGYDFTAEELEGVLHQAGELGDADLTGVTGGASGVPGSTQLSASGVPGSPSLEASGVPGLPTSPTTLTWMKTVGTTLGLR